MGTPAFKGNSGAAYRHPGLNGAGHSFVTVQMGWGTGGGKSGDVLYLQLSGLVTGDINQGVFFQSEVPITVDYTLQNPSVALDFDPDNQADVLWDGAQAIPVKTITAAAFPIFTCARITMGGDGTFCVGVR